MFRHYRRRRWYPRSVLPSVENNGTKQTKLEKIKLLISLALPLAVGIFTLVTTLQSRQFARQERAQDKEQAEDEQREAVFVTYINDIARYRDRNIVDLNNNLDKLLYIRTKTLTALRKLDDERKKHVLLFLKESSLLSNEKQSLWFGADFNRIKLDGEECRFSNVTFWGVQFQYVSLTNCIFLNVTFLESNFNRAILTRSSFFSSRFISCRMEHVNFQDGIIYSTHLNGSTLSYANFQRTILDTSKFFNVNLTGAAFSTISQDHPFIWNSLLPNGTFSQIDEIHREMNECASPTEWMADPGGSIQVNSCVFEAATFNESVSQYGLNITLDKYSILIDANQAEFEFQVRQNSTKQTISVMVFFEGVQNLVFDLRNIGKLSF
jgi:uncharacterized protein YjbI with pentapeptide repeats